MPGAMSEWSSPGARALDGRVPPYRLALWHGFNEALALSAAAVTLGVLLWRMRLTVASLQRRYRFPVAGARVHDAGVGYLLHFADWLTGGSRAARCRVPDGHPRDGRRLVPGAILCPRRRCRAGRCWSPGQCSWRWRSS
jgi:hypothetical protein